jgi:hypothetical protein
MLLLLLYIKDIGLCDVFITILVTISLYFSEIDNVSVNVLSNSVFKEA